jgi:NAD(P)-dependent dehydrogenase (short-subunit alcohol dehydrogenase family)
MNRKTAIVTGASSGFGLLSTIKLAESGFYVIAAMRNLQKKEHLQSLAKEKGVEEHIHYYQLDVCSETSIHQFGLFLEGIDQVDVLLNNAGYAGAGFVEEIPIEQYREQFETNFFGLVAVTQKVIPIMRKQKSGTIINMSSISGLIGFPGVSPYVSSKFALEGFSESLRLELKPFGIDVYVIEPGSYKTNIWTTGKKVAEQSLNRSSPYFHYMMKIEKQLEAGKNSLGDPEEIANLITAIALGKKKQFRFPIGKGTKMTVRLKKLLPWAKIEKEILKRLV